MGAAATEAIAETVAEAPAVKDHISANHLEFCRRAAALAAPQTEDDNVMGDFTATIPVADPSSNDQWPQDGEKTTYDAYDGHPYDMASAVVDVTDRALTPPPPKARPAAKRSAGGWMPSLRPPGISHVQPLKPMD